MLKISQFTRILRSNQVLFFSTRRKPNELKKDGKGKDGLRLFVSNIPQHANWKNLKDHFAESGAKFVSISCDLVTNVSKGCGLVKYDNIDEAQRAIQLLNGSNFLGNIIHVRADRNDIMKKNQNDTKLGNYKGDYNNNKSTNHRSLRKFIQSNGSEISTFEKTDTEKNMNNMKLDTSTIKQNSSVITTKKNTSTTTTIIQGLADITHLLDGKEYIPPPIYMRNKDDITYLLRKDIKTIEELVERRHNLLENSDISGAEEIHAQLKKEFDVSCDDEKKEWSVYIPTIINQSNKRSSRDSNSRRTGDRERDQQPSLTVYRRDKRDPVYIPPVDYEEIKLLILRRAECYVRGETESVEKYNTQLLEQYSVKCHDQNRSWNTIPRNTTTNNSTADTTADSSSSSSSSIDTTITPTITSTVSTTTIATPTTISTPTTPPSTTTGSFDKPYHRDSNDINFLPRNQVASITTLIQERNQYLSAGNLTEAETIDTQLLRNYEVVCIDENNTWTVLAPTINSSRNSRSGGNRSSRGRRSR